MKLHNLGHSNKGADNVVVSVIPLFGHYYAATELPQIIEFDPVTLETIGKVNMASIIPGKLFKIQITHCYFTRLNLKNWAQSKSRQ